MLKIASPRWIATTRRVVKLAPSRMRSTSYTIGVFGSPGRRKYAWSECAYAVRHGASRRDQRLADHLPAEDALATLLRARAAEQVDLDRLEIEELDQSLQDGLHAANLLVPRQGCKPRWPRARLDYWAEGRPRSSTCRTAAASSRVVNGLCRTPSCAGRSATWISSNVA